MIAAFDWSGIWQVLAAAITGLVALKALQKSSRSDARTATIELRKLEAEQSEAAADRAEAECERCREDLAREREEGARRLLEADEKLSRALQRENEAWQLVGTYREKERLWLIERADLMRGTL